MIYLLPIVLLLIGVVAYDHKHLASWRGVWLFVCWLSIVLVAGLRYQVGGDTLSYMYDFDCVMVPICDLTWELIQANPYNLLWVLLNAVCKQCWNDFVLVQLVHAVIVNTAVVYFFAKHTQRVFTALFFYVLCYFLFYNTEIMRASLAMAVFLFGFSTLEKRQWLRYLLVMVIAFGFHSESILMLLFPLAFLLAKIPINWKSVLAIMAGSFVLLGCLLFLPYLSGLFALSSRFAMFVQYIEMGSTLNIFGKLQYFLLVIPWVLVLLLCRHIDQPLMRGLLILAIILSVPMMEYHVIFSRATDFIKPACIVCLAQGIGYCYEHPSLPLRWVKYLAIAGMFGLSAQSLLTGEKGFEFYRRYFPYHSYFESRTLDDQQRIQMMQKTVILEQ